MDDRAPKGIGLTDAGWVGFTTTWKGPPREHRTDAAADLRERLKVERPAHKLKGLLSTFSARAGAAAQFLEETGEAGRLDGARERYTELAGLVEALGPLVAGITIDGLRHRARCVPSRLP